MRVTRSSLAAVTGISATAPVKRALPTTSPSSPTKRVRKTALASAVASAPEPEEVNAGFADELAQDIQLSEAKAEEEGVLLHPALTFKFSDARAHLVATDSRWGPVIDKLLCKPYDGEQKAAFNPFKDLTTSILGQQVSWLAARSIKHKFVRLFYPHLPEKVAPPTSTAPESNEEAPFPTPAQIMALPDPTPTLRSAGLSGRKVEYILELAERFHDGRLDAKKLWEMSDEEVTKTLIAIRGIGIWTVHMFLMFSMKRPDILAVGDLGLQKGLCKWLTADPSSSIAIHPEKLKRASTPEPTSLAVPELPVTPAPKERLGIEAYPTPSSPSLQPSAVKRQEEGINLASPTQSFVFPETSNGLTPAVLKSRLAGKKLKGNIYLSPKEMEELTAAWSPYRSVGSWYLWSITDGTGDP